MGSVGDVVFFGHQNGGKKMDIVKNYIVFDIGGTAVKWSVIDNGFNFNKWQN